MLISRVKLSENELQKQIKSAGLASLLRQLFFKQQSELARELGLTEEQVRGLLSSRLDLTHELAAKLGKVLNLNPDFFSR